MKVRALLDAGDALELDTDFNCCLDVADDLNFGCSGCGRKTDSEWDQAEARKVLDFVLSRWQRRVRSHQVSSGAVQRPGDEPRRLINAPAAAGSIAC
jgi:hypothetical protein